MAGTSINLTHATAARLRAAKLSVSVAVGQVATLEQTVIALLDHWDAHHADVPAGGTAATATRRAGQGGRHGRDHR